MEEKYLTPTQARAALEDVIDGWAISPGSEDPIPLADIQEALKDAAETPTPEWVPFTYGLHDNMQTDERVEIIAMKTGLSERHPVFEDLGRPFYEVILDCELNTNTGEVRILGVKSS